MEVKLLLDPDLEVSVKTEIATIEKKEVEDITKDENKDDIEMNLVKIDQDIQKNFHKLNRKAAQIMDQKGNL